MLDPRTTRTAYRQAAQRQVYAAPHVTWQGNNHVHATCPGPGFSPCLLRVSPPHAAVGDWRKLRRRYSEELSYTHALGAKQIAPKLYQGEILDETLQLAMVLQDFGEDLGRFLSNNKNDGAAGARVGELVVELIRHTASFGLFHADIKQGNIVVDGSDEEGGPFVRLIDFDPRYMSKIEKDGALEARWGREGVAALYAVCMTGLLFLHLKTKFLLRDGQLGDVYPSYDGMMGVLQRALRDSALKLRLMIHVYEPEIQARDCKFFRILARQLHHYHLTDVYQWSRRVQERELTVPTGEKLLRYFEAILIGKLLVKESGDGTPPVFHGREVVCSVLDVSSPPPRLSQELRARALGMSRRTEARGPGDSLTPTPSDGDQAGS